MIEHTNKTIGIATYQATPSSVTLRVELSLPLCSKAAHASAVALLGIELVSQLHHQCIITVSPVLVDMS